MLRPVLIKLAIICYTLSNAQVTFPYRNPVFFKGESIVFTEDYKPHFLLENIKGRFTPTKQELDSAEIIFNERYNLDLQEPKELYVPPVKNVTKEYKYYRRQYLGWINDKKEKVILIQMLNFKNKKRAMKKIEGWEKEFEIGLGDWYNANRFIFEVNFTKGTLKK